MTSLQRKIFSSSSVPSKPLSRDSLLWFLAAQVVLLAPHFFTVPLWIMALWAIVVVWRLKIFQGAWNYPGKLQKTVFVIVCCIALALNFGKHFSLEAMLSLLIAGFVLKLLEIKSQKDFVLLIFIAVFILPTQFLFFNNILSALYGLACIVLLFTALGKLYRTNPESSVWLPMRANVLLLLQAIPFMLLLFVVIPRLGSFWAVPSPNQSKTGMSDSMSPGSFTQLMESDELAFRVSFEGEIPAPALRYWRSLVFSQFDGQSWSQSQQQLLQTDVNSLTQKNVQWLTQIEYGNQKINYSIIAEPTGQQWLFSLAAPEQWNNVLLMSSGLVLRSTRPLAQRINYHVTSALDYRLSANELSDEDLQENLQLPRNFNPESKRKAKEWLDETGSSEKLIEKLLSYYRASFYYTLQPPQLGVNYIDDFLWSTHQGFCEHFSSSFVFFLRAAGIPARVVVGYQGGDINSTDGYLSVRQHDAHAWAEVWLRGRGWVMFDPTAAVAPERVQKGISESLSATDRKFLGHSFGSSFLFLAKIRDQAEALNYQWVRWVMNYDSESQQKFLSRLLDDLSPIRIAFFVVSVGVAIMLCIMLILFVRTPKVLRAPSQRLFRQLCHKLGAVGIELSAGEAPGQFMRRAARLRPDLTNQLSSINQLYEQLSYAETAKAELQLTQALSAFHPKKLK